RAGLRDFSTNYIITPLSDNAYQTFITYLITPLGQMYVCFYYIRTKMLCIDTLLLTIKSTLRHIAEMFSTIPVKLAVNCIIYIYDRMCNLSYTYYIIWTFYFYCCEITITFSVTLVSERFSLLNLSVPY